MPHCTTKKMFNYTVAKVYSAPHLSSSWYDGNSQANQEAGVYKSINTSINALLNVLPRAAIISSMSVNCFLPTLLTQWECIGRRHLFMFVSMILRKMLDFALVDEWMQNLIPPCFTDWRNKFTPWHPTLSRGWNTFLCNIRHVIKDVAFQTASHWAPSPLAALPRPAQGLHNSQQQPNNWCWRMYLTYQ